MAEILSVLETPLGIGGITLGSIFWFVLIIMVATAVAKFVALNIKRALVERVPKNDLDLLTKVVYYIIILGGIVFALPYLNVELSGLLVAGGIVGLVIGFASQSVVSNLVSGLFLMFERPIKIGDNIGLNDIIATVEDIRVLSTIVRTFDGVYVRIPNEKVFTAEITNYVANVARRFEYVISIRYQDDAERAITVIKEVIWAHPFALKNPAPSVYVDRLADSGVNIVVRIWAPSRVWWDVRTELLWKLKVELERNGIEIPFPQMTLTFDDELKGMFRIDARGAGEAARTPLQQEENAPPIRGDGDGG
ncbi:MAG: mechanosensitive ion channel family protein [Methanomicrobiaceae archaeon]|nr:mechanosensitive ion channel family protein [Methanomicrobiaceae archaeon]